MAKIEFLLQALTPQFHAETLRRLLSQRGLDRFIASVAFVQHDGVGALANELKRVAKRTVFFLGIRNNITSIQAVRRLLELRVKGLRCRYRSAFSDFPSQTLRAPEKA